MNHLEIRYRLYCLISLGLWEQAVIEGSILFNAFKVEHDINGNVIVRWYDHYYAEKPNRQYRFDSIKDIWEDSKGK